jgi:hypothetical protein
MINGNSILDLGLGNYLGFGIYCDLGFLRLLIIKNK